MAHWHLPCSPILVFLTQHSLNSCCAPPFLGLPVTPRGSIFTLIMQTGHPVCVLSCSRGMKGHSCNPAPVPHLADRAGALRSDQAQGSALYSQDRGSASCSLGLWTSGTSSPCHRRMRMAVGDSVRPSSPSAQHRLVPPDQRCRPASVFLHLPGCGSLASLPTGSWARVLGGFYLQPPFLHPCPGSGWVWRGARGLAIGAPHTLA